MQGDSQKTGVILAVAAAFTVVAVVGSFITSRQMNRTANEHSMSSGRSGDASPNQLQEQQMDKSARGQSTTGSPATTAVPPAR